MMNHPPTTTLLCLFVTSTLLLASCRERNPGSTTVSNTPLGDGYSLMHGLLDKQSHVDLVLIVKSSRKETSDLVGEIAVFCSDSKTELEELARLEPEPSLQETHLPPLEQAARASAEAGQQELLLGNSGREFERRLLLTQYQSMGYLANLSQALQQHEENGKRTEFLKQIETRAIEFREKAYQHISDL